MTDTPTVVGLHGYAQSGKDSFGKVLVEYFGYSRRAFADPLKAMLLRVNPLIALDGVDDRYRLVDLVEVEGWEYVKANSEARRMLQALGEELHDLKGQDVLLNAGLNSMSFADGEKYVFTDVRYPSEFRALSDLGGTMIRLTRTGTGPINGHLSESLLAGRMFDIDITLPSFDEPENLANAMRIIAAEHSL